MSEEEKKAIQELTEIKELVEEDLKYDDYEVTATLDQIDLKSLVIVLNLIEKQQKEIEQLKKYDYRKIKLDEKDRISSIHFTKKQLDLMNLGIALYVGIPKILKDGEDEETDI